VISRIVLWPGHHRRDCQPGRIHLAGLASGTFASFAEGRSATLKILVQREPDPVIARQYADYFDEYQRLKRVYSNTITKFYGGVGFPKNKLRQIIHIMIRGLSLCKSISC